MFLFSNHFLRTIIQLRTPLISLKTLLNKFPNCLGFNKQQVFETLTLPTQENVILFDQNYYSQTDGVAMGSPLGPTFANIFLCYHETKWLKKLSEIFQTGIF